MKIITRVLNEAGERIYEGQTTINASNLAAVAKFREPMIREKGAKWTADGIPVFGKDLILAMEHGELGQELEMKAINLAKMSWLYDSIYGGVSFEEFSGSHLEFTMLHGGAVVYQRFISTDVKAQIN